MFCFAKVESDQTVSEVIVVAESDCGNSQFPASETVGQSFLASLGKGGLWLQASPSSEYRKNFASVGCKYISDADVFTQPKPYPSWVLDSGYEWQAPTPKPDADGFWSWNETEQKWQR